MEGESKTTREELSEADTLAGAWVRAYLQAWSTCSKLIGRWQPPLLTKLRKGILGDAGPRPVTGDLQEGVGRLSRLFPFVHGLRGGGSRSTVASLGSHRKAAEAGSAALGQRRTGGRRARKKMSKEGKWQELINLRGDRYLTHKSTAPS